MIGSVVFVPAPPILLPAVASGAASELDELRVHCLLALQSGLAEVHSVAMIGTEDTFPIGQWLLEQAGWTGPESPTLISPVTSPSECASLADELILRAREPTLVVVLGDGSACRSPAAPGSFDERAAAFDESIVAAISLADVSTVLEADPQLATDLKVSGRAAWQVAAHIARKTGSNWHGEVNYQTDPYGVLYFVGRWWLAPGTQAGHPE